MNNPKVVLEQIVDSDENKSEKVIGINPLTISRYAYLELIKGDEKQEYTMPFERFETPVNIKSDPKTKETREVKSMQDIQYLGALNTYYKRY